MPIDLIGYINILIGIIDISLGLLVLASNRKKLVNKAYFLCTLTMGIWSFSLFAYDNPIYLDSTSWLKIVYIIAYLMTLTQIYFVHQFHYVKNRKFAYITFSLLGPLFLYGLYLLIIKDSVIQSTNLIQDINTIRATMGADYIFYFLPILLSLAYIFGIHISQAKDLTGLKKKQTQFYWIGGLVMIAPLAFLDFALPVFWGITDYYKYGTLGNILWAIIIAYSIYNTRFLDVRMVLGKIVQTLLKSSYLLAILLIYLEWIHNQNIQLDKQNLFLLITISIILSLVLNSLNQKTEIFIQKKFVFTKYDPVEKIQTFSNSNSKELDNKRVLAHLNRIIKETVNPNKISILLFDVQTQTIKTEIKNNAVNLDQEAIIRFIKNWRNLNSNPILIASEIDNKISSGKPMIDQRKNAILDFMTEYDIEIVLPMELDSELDAVIILGNKSDNSNYTKTDVSFLESLSKNANIAITRGLLYEQLQTFNNTLQSKVNEQTKELQIKVKELEEARRKEADMIDIMGHELRTPATIVKLNASFLTKFVNEIDTNPEGYKKYVNRIQEAIENEIKLINTLLSSAKLEGDKIELNPEEIDIQKEIEMSLHGHETLAQGKNLKVINQTALNTPNIYADKARLVEVLNNLISNAIKYTEKGGIMVKTTFNDQYVKVSVIDTGNGIPKQDLPKLGQKFYRISNYINKGDESKEIVRPGGTGLGLYVTFNLVRKMGGDIWVESEVGKGSIFSFTIPRYKDQQNTQTQTSTNMFERLGLKK